MDIKVKYANDVITIQSTYAGGEVVAYLSITNSDGEGIGTFLRHEELDALISGLQIVRKGGDVK